MRSVLALLLATTAFPALADTITAESTITAVTVYPEGAKITREVHVTLPSTGTHEMLVTDMPATTQPGLMQIAASEGVGHGAFSLRADRLPPREDPLTAEQEAAKAEVERLEAAERDAVEAVDAVQARIDAANAQAAFLGSFSGAVPENATPESLAAMASSIGAGTLAARETAAAARKDLWPAQKALSDVQEALAKARDAFATLPARDADYTALSVALEAEAAGEAVVVVTHYIGEAGWRPYYELNLTRKGDAALSMERSVLVTQFSGEDWAGVDLVLSSSQPAQQAAPSSLWPELRSVVKPQPEVAYDTAEAMMGAGPVMEPEAAPMVVEARIAAESMMEGDTVVYVYPRKVDVASGVEDLRLPLDKVDFKPVVEARAVAKWDQTAFVMARFVNGDEPILPGDALLYREGVLVGMSSLDGIAPNAETELPFGALETLRITREMPKKAGGETGILTTSNRQSEDVVIKVENLGSESWPVRLMDQVPYSEQDDLEIETTAQPEPTETDVDGQRGILAWDFDLPAGGQQTVTLGYTMTWPEGMVLQ